MQTTRTMTAVFGAVAMTAAAMVGAQTPPDALGSMQMVTTHTVETYVPIDPMRIAAIELRGEASISGGEVTLRQVCRWSDADEATFAAVADLVVLRLAPGAGFATLNMDDVQTQLADAGVTPGCVEFSGSLSCTVSRTDVAVNEGDALRQWVGNQPAHGALTPEVPSAPADPVTLDQPSMPAAPAAPSAPSAPIVAEVPTAPQRVQPVGDLRAMLISDIAARLHVPVTALQVDFAAEDRRLLALAAPIEFTIEPQRFGDLGETSWNITVNVGGDSKRVRVRAVARAWIDQVVLTRAIGFREPIGAADIEVKHVLADRLTPDVVASAADVVGKQTSRDLRVGTVLTSRMIAPLELVRAGQTVTVTMRRGAINIRSVATALQAGSAGQTVRVRNPSTNEVYEVQLTGPQTGIVPGSDPVADAGN